MPTKAVQSKRKNCCMSCRRKHRKCVVQPGASQCGACNESGQECQFENGIRFKYTHPRNGQDRREEVEVPGIISFTTPRGINGDISPTHEKSVRPEISATTVLSTADTGAEVPNPRSESGHDPTETETMHLASSPPQFMSTQDVQPLTEREAFLFMTYVHKLAPLSDACDDARHFTLQVPHLALQNPMILHGILALASRYDSPTTLESTYYHNKHINLLIHAFDLPWDTTLLTSVVLARLYEENDPSSDPHTHLSGTQNLLNHDVISRFVVEGGLAEAASWVHLRQTIYVYVARKLPVQICLENFERSGVFQRRDDSAWANRAVFLFARIMKMFLGKREWEHIEDEVEKWFEERPVSFKPIFYKEGDVLEDRPLPVICFAASVPVVGMQHYFAAKTVLCLDILENFEDRNDPATHNIKETISSHLCTLMSLALSNKQAGNAFFLPAHMLSLCGYCIRDPCVRRHTIRYLEKVEQLIRWKTKRLIETLTTQWNNADRAGMMTQDRNVI